MDKEITRIMDHLDIRKDQAIRILRQRAELDRRGMVRAKNFLK